MANDIGYIGIYDGFDDFVANHPELDLGAPDPEVGVQEVTGNLTEIYTTKCLLRGVKFTGSDGSEHWKVYAFSLLQPAATSPAPAPALRWPVVGGQQQLSIVKGEVQDSAAHALRGVPPAVDLAGYNGQQLVTIVPDCLCLDEGYDAANGNWITYRFEDANGRNDIRYSHRLALTHQFGQVVNEVGVVGDTGDSDGNHVHIVWWINGTRVKPEEQKAFLALLGAA